MLESKFMDKMSQKEVPPAPLHSGGAPHWVSPRPLINGKHSQETSQQTTDHIPFSLSRSQSSQQMMSGNVLLES